MPAARPGAVHGPFKSNRGCLLLEIHYYAPPPPKPQPHVADMQHDVVDPASLINFFFFLLLFFPPGGGGAAVEECWAPSSPGSTPFGGEQGSVKPCAKDSPIVAANNPLAGSAFQ